MSESAKHNTMSILRSQSVRAQERDIQSIFDLRSSVAVLSPKDNLRSKIANVRKRKTQWVFFVLKAWEPKSVIFSLSSIFAVQWQFKSKDNLRSKIANVRKRKTQWVFFVLKGCEPKSVTFSLSSQFSGIYVQKRTVIDGRCSKTLSESANHNG